MAPFPEEIEMARRDIEFNAEGVILRGWFYAAEASPAPAVVMAHGFSAVKEMYLDSFAEVFNGAGLNVLVFDNRNFGASDGEPRLEIDPWVQVRDYRHAITFAGTLPEVDAARIGIWGSSYSGGHVLVVAAIDRRVKAVVSQVPLVSGHDNLRALVRSDFIAGFREMFDADRRARFEGKPPAMVPVVDEDPLAASALPTADSWQWFTQTGKTRAPSWRNEVTLRSVEMFTEYEPVSYMPYISPTPLLLLAAEGDHLVPSELAIAAYDKAHEPKKLVILPGGHFDAYVKGFEAASVPARDWLAKHLMP
ncbi:MAG TPA: alpha/beta hydrolase [Streptosporangiaceae bacterium]|nr:alpha/beta hydrolase [Streptosporangiaceae bacterium]